MAQPLLGVFSVCMEWERGEGAGGSRQWGIGKEMAKSFLILTQEKGHEKKCSNYFLQEEQGNQKEKASYVES